jgi:hypothetical protein
MTNPTDPQPTRFTVTIAAGVLDATAAATMEKAIQKTVADTLATLQLGYRVELVDPVRESRREGTNKALAPFDWRSRTFQQTVTPGLVAPLNVFGLDSVLGTSPSPTVAPTPAVS